MKFKCDFVTNSSSSSFVVMGVQLDDSAFTDDHMIRLQNDLPDYEIDKYNMFEYGYELLEAVLKDTDLDFTIYPWDSQFMVGIPYTKMQDDETLAQFRQRVKDQLTQVFKTDMNPGHIEECWMDG